MTPVVSFPQTRESVNLDGKDHRIHATAKCLPGPHLGGAGAGTGHGVLGWQIQPEIQRNSAGAGDIEDVPEVTAISEQFSLLCG